MIICHYCDLEGQILCGIQGWGNIEARTTLHGIHIGGEVLTNRAHLLSALTHGPNSIHGIIQYMCAFVGGSPSLMMLRLVYVVSYNM